MKTTQRTGQIGREYYIRSSDGKIYSAILTETKGETWVFGFLARHMDDVYDSEQAALTGTGKHYKTVLS